MKVILKDFRCWHDLTLEIPTNKITLIKGQSGRGKSTLFQAIYWCLYGGVRLVTPNADPKAKTQVTLELTKFSINRQKNPNRLLVTHNTDIYEDKVAQNIIDSNFGNQECWMASCYIGQLMRNSFLTAPQADKMTLLNAIAFHDEDPSEFIEKIDTEIITTETEHKIKNEKFLTNLKQLQSAMNTVDITKVLTAEQIAMIQAKITELTSQNSELEKIKKDREIDLGILNNLQRQLQDISNKPIVMPIADINLSENYQKYFCKELISSDLEEAIAFMTNLVLNLNQRDKYLLEINRLNNSLPKLFSPKNLKLSQQFTHLDYEKTLYEENAYNENFKEALVLNVVYTAEAINATINKYQESLAAQDTLRKMAERDNLILQLKKLEIAPVLQPIILPEIIPANLFPPNLEQYDTTALANQLNELSSRKGEISNHISHLQKSFDVLACPHCTKPLRYQNSNLMIAADNPINKDELINFQNEFSNISLSIARIQDNMQTLNTQAQMVKKQYEQAVFLGQKRIDKLKENIKGLELEMQRREFAENTRLQNIQVIQEKINSLNIIEPMTQFKLLTAKEIEQINLFIARLSNIKILSLPIIKSEDIRNYLTYQDINNKLQAIKAEYAQFLTIIPELYHNENLESLKAFLNQLKIYYQNIKAILQEQNTRQQLQNSLEKQIVEINGKIPSDPLPLITANTQYVVTYREQLAINTAITAVLRFHQQVTAEREEILTLSNNLSDLQVMRQYAIDSECKILQSMVDSINESIQNVCNSLFDRDISISLNLFKTLKTTKHIKPGINFTISYQGGSYDNINQLSGGEGDRVSLALTLALNRLSTGGLLLLDESLASLDINRKEMAIKTIRENVDSTILLIMQDGVEGIFENVIDMDEILE